MIAKCVVKIWR